MKLNTLASALLVSTLGFSAAANATIIDLFSDPSPAVTVTDSTANATAVAALDQGPYADVIGGYRDVIVNMNVAGFPGTKSEATVGEGYFTFSNGSGVDGTATVQWDGMDGSAALDVDGLGGANLVHQIGCESSGCNAFTALVLLADQGFEYQITVHDMAGNWSTLISDTLFPVGSPYDSHYYFDWFNLAAGFHFLDGLPFVIVSSGGTVDFEDIGAMEFVVNTNGTVAVDLTLDAVSKTKLPEPGTLALLGIGLLGASLVGRRRK